MVAKAGSHLLAATACAVLAGASLSAGAARAQDAACLAAPKGAAPAGTHWFYKTDPTTHQKCWYTRGAAAVPTQTAQLRPAPERGDTANPDSDAAAVPEESAAPVALAPTAAPPAPERTSRPAPTAARRVAPPIARVPVPTADPRGENQPITTAATDMPAPAAAPAAPDNVAWPAPPPMPQTAGAAGSPFPPPPDVSPQADASVPSAAAQTPSANDPATATSPAASATGQAPAAEKPDSGGAPNTADADSPTAATPPGRLSVLLVLGGLIVLLIAGMLLRRIVEHALSRRRVIKLARHEPRLVEPIAVPPPPTVLRQAPSVVPGHGQTAQRASEVEAELRKFAQNLRQPRPAANGTANGTLGRTGTALRS
jgi:hypothetical protein